MEPSGFHKSISCLILVHVDRLTDVYLLILHGTDTSHGLSIYKQNIIIIVI